MTLIPGELRFMTHMRVKYQGHRSVGSKVTVEIDERVDGHDRSHYLICNVVGKNRLKNGEIAIGAHRAEPKNNEKN